MADLADVVIVGGGIMGTAMAYELARRSNRVVLLENRMLAAGATGNGFAWVNATSKETDETYHRLNAEALGYYDTFLPSGVFRTGIEAGGALFWVDGEDAPGQARLNQRSARLQGWGYPVSRLDRADMQALEPNVFFPEGAEGLFAPADRWVTPSRLTRFFVGQARERHGDIREDCGATGFTRMTGAISTVETPQGRIATRTLVLAAGLQTPQLLQQVTDDPEIGHWVPLRAEPGVLVETAPQSAPGSIYRVLYPAGSGGLHLRPTAGGGLLIGAEDIDESLPQDLQGFGLGEASNALLNRTLPLLSGIEEARVRANLAGRICVRPVPVDGYPIIGPVPGVKGVFVAVCHSGITLAPLLASLLAQEIVSGIASPLLAPYRPERFAASNSRLSS